MSGLLVGADTQGSKPLAYVRSVAIAPTRMALPTGVEAEPESFMISSQAKEKARLALRRDAAAIRTSAARQVDLALVDILPRMTNVAKVTPLPAAPPIVEGELSRAAREAEVDAALAVEIDRCGMHAGIEREVWLRVRGLLETSQSAKVGPFLGVGRARATRKLIGRGYSKTDDELLAQAAQQAVSQLAHGMRTGDRAPFLTGGRVLVLRAMTPNGARKARQSPGGSIASERVEVPLMSRQSDVLFQPELPPVVTMVEPDEGDRALKALSLALKDLWLTDGAPNLDSLRALAAPLRLDYLFISRVRDIAIEESPVDIAVGKELRPGIQRKVDVTVDGVLYSRLDDRILWKDAVEGGTIAKTEYVRKRVRIRTDEQAVMDATHTAYAYLRYSFDEFQRRFYR
jgi:hypothetical protein